MSGLVIKLSPKERILINGAVLENGDRRSRLTILTSNANILRLKDAIHPENANTPVKRVCYLAQLLLSGDVDSNVFTKKIQQEILTLEETFICDEHLQILTEAADALKEKRPYSCLKSLRRLLPIEAALLST